MSDNEREVFSVSPSDVVEVSATGFLGQEADVLPAYPQSNGTGVQGAADINDLNLQTEMVEIDPNADATANYVLPDGLYEFNMLPIDKSSYGKDKAQWGPGRDKNADGSSNPAGPIKWMWSSVEYEAVEPGKPYDKQHVFENYVSTMVGRSGTSRVATLLSKLGIKVPERATHLQYVLLLIDESQKRPAICLETEWEASCPDCSRRMKGQRPRYKPAKVGMRFFPELSDGRHDPVVECQYCQEQITARPRVAHYHTSKRAQSQVAKTFQASL